MLLVSLKSPLNWSKIWESLLLWNNKIVKRENFVTGIKIITQNNLIISIVLTWYLPIVNLLCICYAFQIFFCKWYKFCYSALYGANVTYFTWENNIFEDLWCSKVIIFLPAPQCWYRKITISKNGVPKKISGSGSGHYFYLK